MTSPQPVPQRHAEEVAQSSGAFRWIWEDLLEHGVGVKRLSQGECRRVQEMVIETVDSQHKRYSFLACVGVADFFGTRACKHQELSCEAPKFTRLRQLQ